ncbi:TetR family transcriptional regulator [Alsobacter sp. R-9]
MARKPVSQPESKPGAKKAGVNRRAAAAPAGAPPAGSVRDRVIDATMALAAEHDWDAFDLREIAEAADASLAELRDAFPSKGAVLGGLARRVDRIVLDGTGDDLDEEPARERLFDVLMRRLDALAPYRAGLRRMRPDVARDPLSLAALNQLTVNSMRYMLAAAKIDTAGPMGALKAQGAALLWARVLDAWLDDDDPGLARTMAVLDRELRRAGQIVGGLSDLCRITAPLRAVFDRAAERGRRFRERQRAPRDPYDDDESVRAV